jgi:hypothetical protein
MMTGTRSVRAEYLHYRKRGNLKPGSSRGFFIASTVVKCLPEHPVAFRIPSVTRFERNGQPVVSRRRFVGRMLIAVALWTVLTVSGLAVGIAGYAWFEGMSLVDAYVNAAMILSGMGPLGELKTTGGKIFAGTYAILSGLIIVIATGVVLAPIFHRVLHNFHVETTKD